MPFARSLALLMLMCSCAAPAHTGDLIQLNVADNQVTLNVTALGETVCPDVIDMTGVVDGEMAETMVAQLGACKGRPATVAIHSPGGSVFAAMAIQKAIEKHGDVLCVVDGMAASAAFVTLQSCHMRAMTSRSILMAHHASSGSQGQSQELQNTADALAAIDAAMDRFCSKRMGMALEEYRKHVTGGREWWLDVAPALEAHAVDFEADSVAGAMATRAVLR